MFEYCGAGLSATSGREGTVIILSYHTASSEKHEKAQLNL